MIKCRRTNIYTNRHGKRKVILGPARPRAKHVRLAGKNIGHPVAVSRLPTNFNHYPLPSHPCLIFRSYIPFRLVHLWETVCKAYQWGPVEEDSASWHGQTTGNSMHTPCHQWYRWGEWECTDESMQLYGCVWDISVFHIRPIMLQMYVLPWCQCIHVPAQWTSFS